MFLVFEKNPEFKQSLHENDSRAVPLFWVFTNKNFSSAGFFTKLSG